mgnify:CR=1 FL=1
MFLVDSEVRQLQERSWSVREVGSRGVLARYHGVPREPIRFPARRGVTRAVVRGSRGPEDADAHLDGEDVVARLNDGEYLIEWVA